MTRKAVSNTRSIAVFRRIFLLLFFCDSWAENRRKRILAVSRIKLKFTEHRRQNALCCLCQDLYLYCSASDASVYNRRKRYWTQPWCGVNVLNGTKWESQHYGGCEIMDLIKEHRNTAGFKFDWFHLVLLYCMILKAYHRCKAGIKKKIEPGERKRSLKQQKGKGRTAR